jgi:colanic acid/amylovoran biosynthesis glycosyltransferase
MTPASAVLERTACHSAPGALAHPVPGSISAQQSTVPVIYLVNQYPAVSHTFIRREITALEDLGLVIDRQAVRPTDNLVDPVDLAEMERTDYLLRSAMALPVAAAGSLLKPRQCLAAVAICAGMMRRSDRSIAHHAVYFLEAAELARRVRRTKARHIHAHFGTNPAEVAMLAAALAGVSFSFTVHGQDEFDKPEFLGLRRKIAAARFVATVSDYGRAQLMRWCRPEDRSKIHVVRCGLDFSAAPPAPVAAHQRRLNRFVCVGRFCVEKAQHIFVEALALVRRRGRNVEGVLVGDGALRGEIEALAASHGLGGHLTFAGWLSGEKVLNAMGHARALVVSSFAENLPVVIIEAMAMRRPVISTAVAGIPEIVIPGQTGWLAPAGSVEDLARQMEACLDLPEDELAAMGERGRALVMRCHDIHGEARKLMSLFPGSALQDH